MKLVKFECPYEESVQYEEKKDRFTSFVLLQIETAEHGILEFEMDWEKRYNKKQWKLGKLYSPAGILSSEFIIELRKTVENGQFGIVEFLEKKEQEVRETFKDYPKINIQRIEFVQEAVNEEGIYEQHLRVNFLPCDKFFTVFLKKEQAAEQLKMKLIHKKIRGQEGGYLYPGWREEMEKTLTHYWMKRESKMLNQTEKKAWSNTILSA